MSILKVANVHFDSAGTNRIDYLGDDKVRITSANGTVLDGATNDALLRITQTGTGEAIRVEDNTNPNSTPFVINADGTVLIGTSQSQTSGGSVSGGLVQIVGEGGSNSAISVYANNEVNPALSASFRQHRRRPTGTGAIINGDRFGTQQFYGWSGSDYRIGAAIIAAADINGTISDSSMPGSLIFCTTADSDINITEGMRIDQSGNVLIGRAVSSVGLGVKLDVNGSINCSNIFVNGNVVSGGGGSVTITDQSDVTPLQYITFTTTTSGTASSINVASTKLTFNVDTGTLSSTIFNSTSDINKKTNITQITDAVTLVNSMNGVRFDWKDNGLPSLGVIAQDVEKVLPELVSDEKSVNYNGIIAVLIEAVKELSKQVEELKNR
jgi:hypothetical protein